MKQSHSHPWAQQWAIIRRSFIALRRRPISSLIRVLLLPVIVIGAIFYGVKDLDQNSALNASLVLHIKLLAMSITIFNVFASTNTLVTDKATGMKALMMSMGLNRVHYYCAMGISFLIIVLPPTLLIAIISKVYVLDNTVSHLTILGLFILFTIQLDAVSAAGVSFVTSTNYVFLVIFPIALGDILFDTLIHKLIGLIGDSSTPIMLFFASSSPYAVLKYFFNDYAKSHGIPDETEQNLTQPAYLLLIAQLFWIIFFRLFAYWFEEVCPWQTFTSPRHFFYCLERRKSKNDDDEESIESAVSGSRLKYFEQRSSNTADIGIQVRNIRKTFGQQVALNNVSFAIYKGETTLLLGHNGAGKSTLMQIILGQLEPDDGYVRIKNYFGDVSPAIGVCPQTSILDDDLSVKQHLELFNDIKSKISGNERVRHVNQTIVDVSLAGHEYKQPQELSGGMKRKLSLGIAFVGKSNVLILDEPSSGLDPDSRMFVWNAIRRYRSDRTVLLSTQHMEEADYLGDRIAIMSAGRIVCCGSSVYLNKQFGTGYKLRIECRSSRWEEILDYIRYYFDTVQPTEASTNPPLHTDADPIVDLVLELKTNDTNKDPELELIRLLEDLENNAESLSIRSYGLKSSSIEDVMVNTSEYFSPPIESNEPASSKAEQLETITSTRSNVVLLIDLLWALIIKHLQVHKANRLTVLLQKLILPTLGIYILTWNLSSSKIDGLWQDPKVALMVAHLMYFPSRDYASKFKIIQLNSNANVCIYWLAQAMIDLLWLVVPIIALNYSIWKWQYAPVIETWQLHCLVSLALTGLYLASMLACYCLSFAINPKFAISSLYLISAGSSIISLLIFLVSLLIFRSGGSLPLTILAYIGILVCPTDAFAYIFIGLRSKCYIMIANNSSICQLEPGPSPVLVGFLALLFQIALYSSLLFLIEFRSIDVEWYCRLQNILPCFNRATKLTTNESREMDRDVVEETEKALVAIKNVNGPHSLVAALLNKSYIKYNKVIEDLSFTMKRGECFGLLGVNGAGKTTTFSMLATEIAPDSGRILANGNYSDQNQRTYRKGLGYDPQTTPELSLTPYQALSLMARLRSIDRSSLHQVVVAVLDLLEMSQHAHKYDMQLSGGTRRKLALGMALIGNPSILALDEPTAGVDPLARRSVWQLLKSLRAHNSSSIIISSHAMEECEAICDRIAIMARGRLRCIGTFLHLRSKFARGCTLRVQSTTDTIVEQLEQQLTEAIGSSVFSLADRNVHSVTFNITDNRVRRSILFRMMREFRLKHPNISYMINDSSLEDVFITLAREQENFDKQLGRAG